MTYSPRLKNEELRPLIVIIFILYVLTLSKIELLLSYTRIITDFVYLAIILDLYSRKITRYSLSRYIEIKLTLSALRMVISNTNPTLRCIYKSFLDIQYASSKYANELKNPIFESACLGREIPMKTLTGRRAS